MAEAITKRFRCPSHWTLSQRLDHYTDKSGGPNACWPWLGSTDRKGYGLIKWDGRARLVSRLTWEHLHGPISSDEYVCHRCDNPICRNASHFWLGNHGENMADRDAKGRTLRGEQNGSARLTREQVLEIRFAPGTCAEIGKRFGVSPQAVSKIINRKMWKHV